MEETLITYDLCMQYIVLVLRWHERRRRCNQHSAPAKHILMLMPYEASVKNNAIKLFQIILKLRYTDKKEHYLREVEKKRERTLCSSEQSELLFDRTVKFPFHRRKKHQCKTLHCFKVCI